MTDARNILGRVDWTPAMSDRAVQVTGRQGLAAALQAVKRMPRRRIVACVARRVQSGPARALAGNAARRYRACSAGGLGAEPASLFSVRA